METEPMHEKLDNIDSKIKYYVVTNLNQEVSFYISTGSLHEAKKIAEELSKEDLEESIKSMNKLIGTSKARNMKLNRTYKELTNPYELTLNEMLKIKRELYRNLLKTK